MKTVNCKLKIRQTSFIFPLSSSFTLIETLIVIALIATLATASLALLDPLRQVKKAQDARKVQDLSLISRVMEDYYNDKSYYPPASNLCFDTPTQNGSVCSCHTCFLKKRSSELTPYLSSLLCDPQHPTLDYQYQYDCAETNLTWYRLCASLDTRDISSPSPFAGVIATYNYGVGSSNSDLSACYGGPTPTMVPCPADPGAKYCYKNSILNNCGVFANCLTPGICDSSQLYFSNGQTCSR